MNATETAPGNTAGGGWHGRMFAVAREQGYTWPAPQLRLLLAEVVERHGVEKVERAFNWWVKNAARIESSPRWVNPKRFGAMVGYWIVMSAPANE